MFGLTWPVGRPSIDRSGGGCGPSGSTDPALHAGFASIAATVETEASPENADTTLNTSSPSVRPAKRSAVSRLARLGRERILTWERDRPDAQVVCQLVIVEREERAIGGQHIRYMPEASLVVHQTGRQLRCIWWIAHQHGGASDQAAVHFVEHDLATKLGRQVSFAAPHDGGVRFKEAHQLG